MTNKYQEAIGNWEHTIGKVTHVMIPEEDDNYKFLRIKTDSEKNGNQEALFKGVGILYFSMVLRNNPAMMEEEQDWLKKWISVNIKQIIEDFLIAFRWVTPEGLTEAKKKLEALEQKK